MVSPTPPRTPWITPTKAVLIVVGIAILSAASLLLTAGPVDDQLVASAARLGARP